MGSLPPLVPLAVLSPYTDLLVQAAAIALAASVATVLLRRADSTFAERAAIVSVLLVGVVALPNLWSGLDRADALRAQFGAPPGVSYAEKCLSDQNRLDWVGYARWLRTVMPEDAIYSGTGDTCLAFQLLPRLPARDQAGATWDIYPGGLPGDLLVRASEQEGLPVDQRTVFLMPGSGLGAVRREGGGG